MSTSESVHTGQSSDETKELNPAELQALSKNTGRFSPVYAEGYPGSGIGGYDLGSTADRSFAFDYDHSGKLDHLVLFRPNTGIIWILKNTKGTFTPVYKSGSGIGGFNLLSPYDHAFAFDYDCCGKLDHIVLYQPGGGTIWILKNSYGTFSPVYAEGYPGTGIGGYDLGSTADRAFAFDYDHCGRLDHLVLYRPNTGIIWILKNTKGKFSPVFQSSSGIGGFNLLSPNDHAFAFDYDCCGKLDHIVLYQPGGGTIWILKNSHGNFSPVYAEGYPGTGIGGYDLGSTADRAFAFDYDHCGRLDHLVLYRPNTGIIWILKNTKGTFTPVFQSGSGIGGFNLLSPYDHAFAFDYNCSGKLDYIVLYQPGGGTIWILKNS